MFFWVAVILGIPGAMASESDPLPSWNEGDTKEQILAFVDDVTREGSPNYVPKAERVATFDNDGNLWSEQPMYFQLYFALDRVRAMADDHPEWKEEQPFKGVLEGDMGSVLASGEEGLIKLVMASHAGMTTAEFNAMADEWLKTARHPVKDRLFTDLVYQPMLELLQYLRDNGFKTFIVSGGGIDLVRLFSEEGLWNTARTGRGKPDKETI